MQPAQDWPGEWFIRHWQEMRGAMKLANNNG
jgi:hypothetical protein